MLSNISFFSFNKFLDLDVLLRNHKGSIQQLIPNVLDSWYDTTVSELIGVKGNYFGAISTGIFNLLARIYECNILVLGRQAGILLSEKIEGQVGGPNYIIVNPGGGHYEPVYDRSNNALTITNEQLDNINNELTKIIGKNSPDNSAAEQINALLINTNISPKTKRVILKALLKKQ